MDESSRYIVKFIAAGTGAILLLMAAYFYGQKPEAIPMPVPPVEASEPAVGVPEPQAVIPAEEDDRIFSNEDVKPIDGQPTMLVDEQVVNAQAVVEQAAVEQGELVRE